MSFAQPLDRMMNDVARKLLGDPNDRMSKARDGLYRFGSQGSIEVNTREGWFADYEANVRGGVLDLIAHKAGISDPAAQFRWLEEHGIKEPSNDTGPTPAAFYDYRDETGALLFKVERRGKGMIPPFLQHGPDGRGGFHAARGCMQGVRRVLYRLPELVAADQSAIVFVCEGEKDADRLARAGLVSTTNPGGAGKFLADFAPLLAGRRVVALEDNDQAGHDHAADVRSKLDGVAADVTTLKLPGAAKSDVSDWLNNGGSAHELVDLAEQALGDGALPLMTLDLAALSQTRAKAKEFAIERLAPLAEVTLLTGAGSAGKSLLGQQIATAAAGGVPCLGLAVQAGPTLFLTCEDDADQLHWRQEHLCAALGLPMADLAGKLHLVSLRGELGNELATFSSDGKMTPAAAFQRVASMLRKTGAKLAFLDNVAHLFVGNENDRGDVTRFVNLLNKLAGETGAAIVLLGHPNKQHAQGNKQGNDHSGSTAWNNAVRSRGLIEHDEETDIRTLSVPKANYGKKGELVKFRWVDWAFCRDADLPSDKRAEMDQIIRANSENAAFLRCMDLRNEQERPVSDSPASRTYAPKEFATMAEAKGVKQAGLVAAMDRLFRTGEIEIGLVCRTGRKDRFGLRRKCADPRADPAPTGCADPAPTPRSPAPTHTPSTTYNTGAASWSAAPDEEGDLDYSTSREDGDD